MEIPLKFRSNLDAAKERLRIPDLWQILRLEGKPGKICRSPFREDRKPSFSVYDEGLHAHDFGTGEHFDAISFLAKVRGLSNGEAIRAFLEIVNGHPIDPAPIIRKANKPKPGTPNLLRLRKATRVEIERIAKSRKIIARAVECAQDMGTLRTGKICGYESWILLDEGGLCAEGRRLNRKPYPAISTAEIALEERKAHTLRGSRKDWPVGILPTKEYRQSFEAILLVEGGPDYLAALHFALAQKRTGILPVAMLGRCQGLRGFHPDSLQYFRGMRVRIYPHNDPDRGSYKSAVVLAKQLQKLDCGVDCFVFEGLSKANGVAVKDLNDCVEIASEHAARLEELFP
jgi:hypothetical protein